MGEEGERGGTPIFRDIRRYYCEYCGICRSKKSLITSHILTHHEEEMKKKEQNEENGDGRKLNVCEECGASFQKPAHLKQHMQSHSLERAFTCPVDDCNSSYRRKDHLTRHMLQHKGKLFECLIQNCKRTFTVQGNMTRHLKELHDKSVSPNVEPLKEYVCEEQGCGKAFKYLSKLRKHEESHVKLDSIEAFCAEPGCMKYFTNEQCLKDHILSCHQHIICDKCGTKQLKKNIKRHMRMHEEAVDSSERIECSVKGCSLTFSTTSNLNHHIKAVHLKLKPFTCSIPGCQMRFAFKHVRDNHENSGCHIYTRGDFVESDEQFRSRPRGGRKRNCPVIETLFRKRVVPPTESEVSMNEGRDYPSWLHSSESED